MERFLTRRAQRIGVAQRGYSRGKGWCLVGMELVRGRCFIGVLLWWDYSSITVLLLICVFGCKMVLMAAFLPTRRALKNGSVPTARGGTFLPLSGVYPPVAPMGQIIWSDGLYS